MQQRITISLDEAQAAVFDRIISERGYRNRSEAFRDLIRSYEAQEALRDPPADAHCVAVASYVYNHHERQLSMRLTELQHAHGGLVISLMHAHIACEDCMEALFLRGTIKEVRAFAEELVAQPGIRHGQVNIIPVESDPSGHEHHHPHPHEEGD